MDLNSVNMIFESANFCWTEDSAAVRSVWFFSMSGKASRLDCNFCSGVDYRSSFLSRIELIVVWNLFSNLRVSLRFFFSAKTKSGYRSSSGFVAIVFLKI